ncbi:MAG TPA: iron-sulfur cluster assembly scaffold protein [Parvularculaceae bacterium]|nr:iron-sulfur cluster assembly scaffold protein [Parvularculaceae bacterium]
MIGELYSDRILAAASSIPAARRLAGADASAKKVSRVCGSEVDVDLKMDGDTVSDFGMEARACALGQAAASIVARHVVGASAAELYQLRDEMKAMLKEGGPPPSGERWADLAVLEPIRDYPQRHASTMLVFEAIAACLDQLSAQHGEA